MILRRPWLLIALAGCSWAHLSRAQTGAGTTTQGGVFSPPLPTGSASSGNQNATGSKPADSGTTGGSPTSGTTDATNPPPLPTKPGDETPAKPSNPFGFADPPPPTVPRKPGLLTPDTGFGPNGASSNFGTGRPIPLNPAETPGQSGTPRTKREENPIKFETPGFFGSGRQSFTSGEGRFAKPRYRYGGSFGMGFDDNFQQTPDNTGQEGSISIQIIPAVEEIATIQTRQEFAGVRPGTQPGTFVPFFRTVQQKIVLRPFQPEQRIETPIPEIPPTPRLSSIISTADVFFNTQWVKPRSAFTLDLRLGTEYYWDREKDPLQYNGSFSVLYVRKLTSRMQLTLNSSITHTTQPDFSQVNVNTDTGGGGGTTNGLLKADLSYRWTPRFSTNSSLGTQVVMYDSAGANAGNNLMETTLGNEFRYISSPKLVYVIDTRYTLTGFPDDPTRNSSTVLLLLGLEQKWSRRLGSSFRIGQAFRTFDSGGSQATPYGEWNATYQVDSRSQFSLNGRYGFESTQSAGEKNVTFRTGLGYTRAITPRLSGAVNLAFVKSVTTVPTLADAEFENQTIDGSASLAYRFSRRFNMSARYSYTSTSTSAGLSDYDRSRFFLTGSYEF